MAGSCRSMLSFLLDEGFGVSNTFATLTLQCINNEATQYKPTVIIKTVYSFPAELTFCLYSQLRKPIYNIQQPTEEHIMESSHPTPLTAKTKLEKHYTENI